LSVAPNGNPPLSYWASAAVRDHRWPTLTPYCTDRPVLDLSTLGGRKAKLTLVVGYIPRWFTCRQRVTHSGTTPI